MARSRWARIISLVIGQLVVLTMLTAGGAWAYPETSSLHAVEGQTATQDASSARIADPMAPTAMAPVEKPKSAYCTEFVCETVADFVAPAALTTATLDTFFWSKLLQPDFGYIMAADLNAQLSTVKPFVVDVRSKADYHDGHVPGAVNIEFLTLLDNLDKLPAKDKPIVVYCGIGHNGAIAMTSLSLLGYTNVKSVVGGFTFWSDANPKLPVER